MERPQHIDPENLTYVVMARYVNSQWLEVFTRSPSITIARSAFEAACREMPWQCIYLAHGLRPYRGRRMTLKPVQFHKHPRVQAAKLDCLAMLKDMERRVRAGEIESILAVMVTRDGRALHQRT